MLIREENRITGADGYKYSHQPQYPFGANKLDTLDELEEELSEFEQMLEELNNEED